MRRALGQAARGTGRLVHVLLQIALALVIAAAVAGGALAWRLAQRPIELTWMARRLESIVNADGGPTRLVVGDASLAWNGFTRGAGHPLEIVLTGIAAVDPAGQRIAQVPRAELTLSPGWLLAGRLVPRTLDLSGVRLRALRAADGAVTVDLGSLGEDGSETAPEPATPASSAAGMLIDEFARPPAARPASPLARLESLQLHDAALIVVDRQIGATWHATGIRIDLRRRPEGGLDGNGDLTLSLGAEHIHVTAEATLREGTGGSAVRVQLSPVNPARLAGLAPALAPLATVDAPLTLAGSAELAADLAPSRFAVQASLGAGRVLLGTGSLPVVDAAATGEGTPSQATFRLDRLVLTPRPEGPRTVLHGHGEARRDPAGLQVSLAAELDQVAFADLPALWPAGVGGPGTRPWITANITAGVARGGRVALSLTAPADLSDAMLTSLEGGIDGQDLTVHWLRPVPPVEHVNGRLSFVSPDTIEIAVSAGRQAGGTQGGITLQDGTLRIDGIAGHDQFLTVETALAGPVPDLLAVLKQPRLKLFEKRPLDLRDPAGTVAGHLSVLRLPLRDDVSIDDLRLQASGKLSRLHLGGIAAGRDLDQGALDFETSTETLRLRGTAELATIPARLQVDMDFRGGPPSEVLQKVVVSGTAEAAQLAAAGLDAGDILEGPTALQATVQSRRDGRGDIAVRADFAGATLQVPRLDFRKPPASPATGEARVVLDHDRITAIDRLRLDGDGLALAARVFFAGGHPQSMQIDHLRLGPDTEGSGELRFPAAAGDPWVARLNGRSLDASGQFGHTRRPDRPRPEDTGRPGQPWRVQARFGQVVLGQDGRVMRAVTANGASDGLRILEGRIEGRTAANAGFAIEIAPRHGVRTLSGSADDAGGLLRALDLVDTMQGGRMTLTGTYNDAQPGLPLTGTAEITDFRMQKVPGLAKVLQAMTLYGLVEALQGPGLGFTRLVAPFRLTGDLLELNDARAFSASLGMTAQGQVDVARSTLTLDGTIVPAYFFNSLLGRIPLVGRLFSPEQGGGLFAATYRINGPFADPAVSVNPLAALTPGFLRGVFGIFDGQPGNRPTMPPAGQGMAN